MIKNLADRKRTLRNLKLSILGISSAEYESVHRALAKGGRKQATSSFLRMSQCAVKAGYIEINHEGIVTVTEAGKKFYLETTRKLEQ